MPQALIPALMGGVTDEGNFHCPARFAMPPSRE